MPRKPPKSQLPKNIFLPLAKPKDMTDKTDMNDKTDEWKLKDYRQQHSVKEKEKI